MSTDTYIGYWFNTKSKTLQSVEGVGHHRWLISNARKLGLKITYDTDVDTAYTMFYDKGWVRINLLPSWNQLVIMGNHTFIVKALTESSKLSSELEWIIAEHDPKTIMIETLDPREIININPVYFARFVKNVVSTGNLVQPRLQRFGESVEIPDEVKWTRPKPLNKMYTNFNVYGYWFDVANEQVYEVRETFEHNVFASNWIEGKDSNGSKWGDLLMEKGWLKCALIQGISTHSGYVEGYEEHLLQWFRTAMFDRFLETKELIELKTGKPMKIAIGGVEIQDVSPSVYNLKRYANRCLTAGKILVPNDRETFQSTSLV